MRGNKLVEIKVSTNGAWSSNLEKNNNNYYVVFNAKFSNKKYKININKNEYLKSCLKSGRKYGINYDSQGPYWSFKDINKDGIAELVESMVCDGLCHGDPLALVNVYYKYNKTRGFIPIDYNIETYY